MKKLMLLYLFIAALCSCETKKVPTPESIALGEKLFADKTCVSCHDLNKRMIGPGVQEIVDTYKTKGVKLEDFFSGKTKPIVDTDPGQIAIMNASLTGILKNLPENEREALAAYMRAMSNE